VQVCDRLPTHQIDCGEEFLAPGAFGETGEGVLAGRTRTAPLNFEADLAVAIDYAWAHAEAVGPGAALSVCTMPAVIGVVWVLVALPGDIRGEQLVAVDRFSARVPATDSGN